MLGESVRRSLGVLGAKTARAVAKVGSLDARERAIASAAWSLSPWVHQLLRTRKPKELLVALERLDPLLMNIEAWWRGSSDEELCPMRVEQVIRWAIRAQPMADYSCLLGACIQYVAQRAHGDRVVLVIGTRRSPNEAGPFAHAWVELVGAPRTLERAAHSALLEFPASEGAPR